MCVKCATLSVWPAPVCCVLLAVCCSWSCECWGRWPAGGVDTRHTMGLMTVYSNQLLFWRLVGPGRAGGPGNREESREADWPTVVLATVLCTTDIVVTALDQRRREAFPTGEISEDYNNNLIHEQVIHHVRRPEPDDTCHKQHAPPAPRIRYLTIHARQLPAGHGPRTPQKREQWGAAGGAPMSTRGAAPPWQ